MTSSANPDNSDDKNDSNPRAQRFVSHALVEVRTFKSLPIFCHSAVLLDISIHGYKIEFTSEIKKAPGSRCWLNVPLSPLGIYAPKKLLVHSEFRWFDHKRFRVGGVFIDLEKQDILIIEQIIESLKNRKSISR